jgi:hypothetical protein
MVRDRSFSPLIPSPVATTEDIGGGSILSEVQMFENKKNIELASAIEVSTMTKCNHVVRSFVIG